MKSQKLHLLPLQIRFDFIAMILILNSITKKRQRNARIIDCTDVSVDVNYFRNPVRQKDLEGKEYRWGCSPKGVFIGMKLTFGTPFSQASSLSDTPC